MNSNKNKKFKDKATIKTNKHTMLAVGIASVIVVAGIITFTPNDNAPQHQSIESPKTVSVDTSKINDHQTELTTKALIKERAALADLKKSDSESTPKQYPKITPTTLSKHFSPNLEGTDIDGQIRVGEDNKIALDLEVKDFFDYFLSASSEVGPEVAIDELLAVIDQSLPPENALEARELLENYLAYKELAVELMSQPMLPRDQQTREYQLQIMQDSLRELRALRRQTMTSEAVEAFFGLEEAYEDYTLATVQVQFDDTLSPEEKAGLIQYHRSQLPAEIRRTEETLASDNERNSEIHAAITNDDEETIASRLDEHGYTEEQKQEILEFKRQQVEFDERYQAYLSERQSLLSSVTNEAERESIISNLREQYFHTEQELTQAKVRDLNS